jgi:hypothetical protein
MGLVHGHLKSPCGRAELGRTALPSPVSTGSGSKGLVSIALLISVIPLAVYPL